MQVLVLTDPNIDYCGVRERSDGETRNGESEGSDKTALNIITSDHNGY
jgi:hypothetical protein